MPLSTFLAKTRAIKSKQFGALFHLQNAPKCTYEHVALKNFPGSYTPGPPLQGEKGGLGEGKKGQGGNGERWGSGEGRGEWRKGRVGWGRGTGVGKVG